METYTVKVDEDGVFWYKKDTYDLHRLDGPAVEFANGDKSWFRDGKRHRLDGPAVEFANGIKKYYIDGKWYPEEEFDKKVVELNKPSCDGKVVEIDGRKYVLHKLNV